MGRRLFLSTPSPQVASLPPDPPREPGPIAKEEMTAQLATTNDGGLKYCLSNCPRNRIRPTQLCEALKEAASRANKAEEMQNDYLVDLECDLAEDLLGAIFVIGQRFITSVVSAVKEIEKEALKHNIHLSVSTNKSDLLAFGHTGSLPSSIHVIEACRRRWRSDEN